MPRSAPHRAAAAPRSPAVPGSPVPRPPGLSGWRTRRAHSYEHLSCSSAFLQPTLSICFLKLLLLLLFFIFLVSFYRVSLFPRLKRGENKRRGNECLYPEDTVLHGEEGTIRRENVYSDRRGSPRVERGPYPPLPSDKVTGGCSGRERGRLQALETDVGGCPPVSAVKRVRQGAEWSGAEAALCLSPRRCGSRTGG